MKAYHFLRADMTTDSGTESPWEIGEERTYHGEIVLCQSGYHSSPTLWDAFGYARGPVACLVEISKPVGSDGTETAGNRKSISKTRKLLECRNIERELRLFAADCAEHVLHIFEREYPNDYRPRLAIQAARDFVNGKIDAAARDAAKEAARDAAWNAAWAATWNAVRNAALAAAEKAARNAARDAAWATAWNAARDAEATARNAARDAARATAWATAWNAARKWQRDHFNQMFDGIFDAELVEKEPKP